MSKEFKLNELITLKLEGDKTNIYIKGKHFSHCKSLLFNSFSVKGIKPLEQIQSIDELEEVISQTYKRSNIVDIPPETEFWGHCSNLEIWIEMNYDTRLLHRSMAFSLLKELVRVGDFKARKVFKEEIVKRLLSGHGNVIEFIFQNEYINFLNKEELLIIHQDPKCPKSLQHRLYYQIKFMEKSSFHIENTKEGDRQQNCKIVKINQIRMDDLGIKAGDYISLFGRGESIGIAFPSFSEDIGKGIISVGDSILKSIGINKGDTIKISKTKFPLEIAFKIELALTSSEYRITKRSLSYVKKKLYGIPVVVGDILRIQIGFSSEIEFEVMSLTFHRKCIITKETIIEIAKKNK